MTRQKQRTAEDKVWNPTPFPLGLERRGTMRENKARETRPEDLGDAAVLAVHYEEENARFALFSTMVPRKNSPPP
jgi:hypothetical protein